MRLALLVFLFSLKVMSLELIEFASIGCTAKSVNAITKLTGAVDIQAGYLSQFSVIQQKTIILDHIDQQIKYLIGASKEYHSKLIQKFAIGHFRRNLSIVSQTNIENKSTDLTEYWKDNIHLGSDEYIRFIKDHPNQTVAYVRISYEVDVLLTFCADSSATLEQVVSEIESIPVAKDPYLGFWINTPDERSTRILNPNLSGVVGSCISNDFLIYGTTPDIAWFYWEPVHLATNAICPTKQSFLLTNFHLQISPNQISSDPPALDSLNKNKIDSTFIFGIIDHNNLGPNKLEVDERIKAIQATFDQCQKITSPECLSNWTQLITSFRLKKADPGFVSLLYVLKFSTVLIKDIKHKVIQKGENFFEIQISGITKVNSVGIKISVYHGPTSVYDKPRISKFYWKFLLNTLYTADAVFYFGHAGIGQNLKLSIVEKNSETKNVFSKRTKDLFMGIFNCEGFSYFGFDYENLFNPKDQQKNLYLVSSSGVEVRSDIMLGYLEQIINKNYTNTNLLAKNLSDFVSTRDFYTFQHVRY